MFGFVRRLFGAGSLPPPDGLPPGTVATVIVQGHGGARAASGAATLVARGGDGGALLTVQVRIETDPALVAQLDPARRAGDFAEGDYAVEAVLPAREDAGGAALFGPNPMLRLRSASGEAAPPSLYGRTVLLIHGGPFGRPTDGSIRMADADLARLLSLLPPDPTLVRVRILPPSETAEAGDWDGVTDDRPWRDDDTAGLYYEQLYGWHAAAAGSPPYPDLSAPSDADTAAAVSLAELGYAVLPDQGSTGLDAAASAIASTPVPDPGWAPPDGAYGP